MVNKEHWLHVAEVIDSLRVFPRLVLLAYGAYVYHITEISLRWYFLQPPNGRGTQETALIGIVITAVTGFAPLILQIYSNGGRAWGPVDASAATGPANGR